MADRENKYDKVMRENLVRPSAGFISYFLPLEIVEIIPVPPRTRQTIVEKETDTLVLIKAKERDPFILHIEFQSSNDPGMPKRMAVYDYMMYLENKQEIVSIVIYIGKDKLTMENSVSFNGNHYAYQLIDIRQMDPELFLRSENPRETILAILAGNKEEEKGLLIKRILAKLHQLLSASQAELMEH